eukprot:CAMPEP_0185257446 /NCGR_PEP_ID=MMETSP1359-20130426/6514_1 /TAXON_ID=552665 /ORGANISM="Bigelowiella longifila, Strain CCMP242" /LENGTH=300 /DNA_ID=CAMNT_0027842545 /DNA_START=51 /DNA_END=953 /DNA_ORIENTATION=+
MSSSSTNASTEDSKLRGGESIDGVAKRIKKLYPREYFRKHLEFGIRTDGRKPMDIRRTAVSTDTIKSADGSSVAKVGNTTVACGIKLEVGVPSALSPKEGRIMVNLTMAPLSSPSHSKQAIQQRFMQDKVTESIAVTVLEAIQNAHMVNLEELCIKEGESVWVCYLDLVCLDYSGNLFDASLIAAVGALKSLVIPPTVVADDGEVMLRQGSGSNLTIIRYPIPVSFIILEKKHVVADPSAEEEQFQQGRISIVYSIEGDLCLLKKEGGAVILQQQLKKCMKVAATHAKGLAKSLAVFASD